MGANGYGICLVNGACVRSLEQNPVQGLESAGRLEKKTVLFSKELCK